MTEDIKQMVTELATIFEEGSTLLTPRPSVAPTIPRHLLNAETLWANHEYNGPDWKHLLVKPGDQINVYAFIDEVTAIGFNTRTGLGGRFPVNIAEKFDPGSPEKPEILLCITAVGSNSSDNPFSLSIKIGHYVRVCRRESTSNLVYGFNQSTLDMGTFDPRNINFKKVEWMDRPVLRPKVEQGVF
jgi:hypothetical protein